MGLLKPGLRKDIEEKQNRPGVLAFVSVRCVAGLPVPEDIYAQIYYFEDRVEIVCGGVEYILPAEKIQDISIQTSLDVQRKFVSSIGGAALGAAVAGPVGAAIGGRVKEKKTVRVLSYLVIYYTNQAGESTYLAFDASHTPKCQTIAKLFQDKKTGATPKQVTL